VKPVNSFIDLFRYHESRIDALERIVEQVERLTIFQVSSGMNIRINDYMNLVTVRTKLATLYKLIILRFTFTRRSLTVQNQPLTIIFFSIIVL